MFTYLDCWWTPGRRKGKTHYAYSYLFLFIYRPQRSKTIVSDGTPRHNGFSLHQAKQHHRQARHLKSHCVWKALYLSVKTVKARGTTKQSLSPPHSPHRNRSAEDCTGQTSASPAQQTHTERSDEDRGRWVSCLDDTYITMPDLTVIVIRVNAVTEFIGTVCMCVCRVCLNKKNR